MKVLFLIGLITCIAPLAADHTPPEHGHVDAVGEVEDEDEVANRIDRKAPNLYEKNKWEVERQRKRKQGRCPQGGCPKPQPHPATRRP